MRHRLQLILPAAILVAGLTPGLAQTTGRITGKVTAKSDGKPVVDAKITLKRTDRAWTKTLTSDAKGVFGQAGLDPTVYEVTVTAEGFVPAAQQVKIPLGDILVQNFQLLRPNEAAPQTGQVAPPADEGAKEENEGLASFNGALPLYNEGKFVEALGPVEASYTKLTEAMAKTKDEGDKANLRASLDKVERIYGICLFETGKKAEAKPLLEQAFARNEPEGRLDKSKWDTRVVDVLYKIAKSQKDTEGEKKYQAIIDSIVGPRPENAYNDGVSAFNAGKFKEAKEHIQKAIQIKPDFADSYYLLGLIELNNGNMKAAKQHLQKYLELDPQGKKAAEVKDILKAL